MCTNSTLLKIKFKRPDFPIAVRIRLENLYLSWCGTHRHLQLYHLSPLPHPYILHSSKIFWFPECILFCFMLGFCTCCSLSVKHSFHNICGSDFLVRSHACLLQDFFVLFCVLSLYICTYLPQECKLLSQECKNVMAGTICVSF